MGDSLKTEAERYIKVGMQVGPAVDKKILIDKWQKHTTEEFLDEKYNNYWTTATGLGLLCGEPTGVICLDIDLILDKSPELIKEITDMLPPILSGKRGNPKKRPSQFFRYSGEKAKKFNNIHVEILSTGNQTIIPPSNHPDTKAPYEWVGDPLYNISSDELPPLPDGLIAWLEEKNNSLNKKSQTAVTPGVGRCAHGSHNKISALGVALFHNKYPFDRLVRRLIEKDKEINYKSEYFYFNCPSRPWKQKSIEENAKDFVEQIFNNHLKIEDEPAEQLAVVPITIDLFSPPEMPIVYVEDAKGNKKVKAPSQAQIADHIVAHFGQLVMKYEKDLFTYVGTHWEKWSDSDFDRLYNTITDLLERQTASGRVDGVAKFVNKLVTSFTKNPFEPNPFVANFRDGTLEAIENADGYDLKFREHRKEDMCLSVIPMKYNCDRNIKNEKFESMINDIIGSDQEKLRVLKQMYGSVIMPIFPHLFMMIGMGGTGKSSAIKGSVFLRDQNSISNTDPSSWAGTFGLEPMIGKLVNIDLDIDTHKPIADSLVKKIEDRYSFSINRKNKAVIKAPIPSVHIFGANKLPPTLEWGSKAHDRRWTFIRFNKYDGSENADREYSHRMCRTCPEGVLNFALEGLNDLMQSKGKYFVTKESKDDVREWQLQNDSVGQFAEELLEAAADGVDFIVCGLGGSLRADKDSRVQRKDFWLFFVHWHIEAFNRKPSIGRNKFLTALNSYKITSKKSDGVHYILGFSWYGKTYAHL